MPLGKPRVTVVTAEPLSNSGPAPTKVIPEEVGVGVAVGVAGGIVGSGVAVVVVVGAIVGVPAGVGVAVLVTTEVGVGVAPCDPGMRRIACAVIAAPPDTVEVAG